MKIDGSGRMYLAQCGSAVGEFGHASSKRNVHRQAKFSKKLQTGYSTVSRSRLRTGLMAAVSD
jgi:hypothetical protein